MSTKRILPFVLSKEDAELQALIAEGLARKPERPLSASFWKQQRPNLPLRRVVKAVIADRDERWCVCTIFVNIESNVNIN